MQKRNIGRVIRSAASCCYGEMHFLNASDAWDSLAIWRFSLVSLVHSVNFEYFTEFKQCTFYIFSEGEVEDDDRPEEACASTLEPMAPVE